MTILGVLEQLHPKKVFEYFETLCQIPHGSYHCKAISDFCVQFAKDRNLSVYQDEFYNVVIRKEASPSYENRPTLIFQGHLDMVCQKEPGYEIDFETEGLSLETDGEWVWAKGTTLGGDDGIAVAYGLAILDDDSIKHPALEVVFTTEEEVGMEGATGFDASVLKGKYLINADSEDEGILLSACAGGTTIQAEFPLEYEHRQQRLYEVSILGLQGGHSGTEIDKNHGNAHKMMGQIVSSMPGILISRLWGAKEQKDNAIPYECHCQFTVDRPEELGNKISIIEHEWKKQYQLSEPDLLVEFRDLGIQEADFLTEEKNGQIIRFLSQVKNGIYTMSRDIEGLVESSLNLGILSMDQKTAVFSFGVRSCVAAKKEEIAESIQRLCEENHGIYHRANDYPAWEYRENSLLRDAFCRAYRELYGKEIKVEAIHAGLECGIFASKIPDLDIVSFGPDILDIHTVQERMNVSSVKRTWELLLKIIEEFP